MAERRRAAGDCGGRNLAAGSGSEREEQGCCACAEKEVTLDVVSVFWAFSDFVLLDS